MSTQQQHRCDRYIVAALMALVFIALVAVLAFSLVLATGTEPSSAPSVEVPS